jgi:Flp pilus assembly secretin CpaC
MAIKGQPLQWTIFAAALLQLFFEPSHGEANENIQIRRGFSQILKLDHAAQLVTVGNPNIADVTLGTGNTLLVLTGKKTGTTNIIALGQDGSEIFGATVEVGESRDDDRIRIRIRYPSGNKNKDPGSSSIKTFVCDPNCDLSGKEELLPADVSRIASSPTSNEQ